MNTDPLPPVVVILPDGQQLNGLLHARLQTQRACMYQVGLPMWQATADEWVEPTQYVVWVPADHVRLLTGVSYEDVLARGPEPGAQAPPHAMQVTQATQVTGAAGATDAGQASGAAAAAGTWRIQRLPRERGRPGWNVMHVHDCEDADDGDILDVGQALDVVRQPGTRVCTKCAAAETLPPLM